jgi:hypothetical protein
MVTQGESYKLGRKGGPDSNVHASRPARCYMRWTMKFAVEITAKGIDFPKFREIFYSDEFNEELAEALKLKERSQLEVVIQPDGKERRRVHIVPRGLPAPVQKLLGGGGSFGYDEVTVFDPETRRAAFVVETPGTDAVQITGEARFFEEVDRVRLRFEGEAKVKVFAIGGVVERHIVSEVKSSYEQIERLLQQFIEQGRKVHTTPPPPLPAS